MAIIYSTLFAIYTAAIENKHNKKLNLTQQKQTTQEQNGKKTHKKQQSRLSIRVLSGGILPGYILGGGGRPVYLHGVDVHDCAVCLTDA